MEPCPFGFVPLDGRLQPGLERRPGLETKGLQRPGRVELPSGLPVRFRRIPDDPSPESRQRRHEPDEIPDADLERAADIDRLRAVIALRREHDGLRRILHEEELACGGTVAPDDEFVADLQARVDALVDERRNDMGAGGVELVARAVEVHGKQEDRIESVFLSVRLPLNEQHLLCKPVGGVRLLRISVP